LSTIKQLIQQLAESGDKLTSLVCRVKSVDGYTCDVEPINGDADILAVRLVADEKDDFFVLVPKVDSLVIVSFLNETAAYVSMFSEVSEIKYKIGTAQYSVKESGFMMKKGADTIKDVIRLIIEGVQQILVVQGNNPDYAKLTQALTKLNNIMQ